jgi:WD40 repeat protein
VETGECKRNIRSEVNAGSVFSLEIVTGSGLIAAGYERNTFNVLDMQTGKLVRKLYGHTGFVTSMITLDTGRLASGSMDNTVKVRLESSVTF